MVLIVCKGIVELHGGTISVSSDGIGTGCTFHIDLPLAPVQKREIMVRNASNAVMIRDDNKCFRDSRGMQPSIHGNLSNFFMSTVKKIGIVGKIQPLESQQYDKSTGNIHTKPIVLCRTSIKTYQQSQPDKLSDVVDLFDPSQKHTEYESRNYPSTARLNCKLKWNGSLEVEEIKEKDYVQIIPEKNVGQQLKRILIVDDVPMNRKMLRRVLENRYDIIDEAENGQEAVDMVKATVGGEIGSYYDMITMDYQMPVLDGITATRRIRDVGYVGLIIAVTGNALEADVTNFLNNGADAVLTKPLSVRVLDDCLETLQKK